MLEHKYLFWGAPKVRDSFLALPGFWSFEIKGVERKELEREFSSMCLSRSVGCLSPLPHASWENEKLHFCKMYDEYS